MSRDAATKKFESRIRERLRGLRTSIANGHDNELHVWILAGELAASQRPLRDDPEFDHRYPLPPSARSKVERWVTRMRDEAGIRSVICLLTDYQLNKYYVRGGLSLHPDGLLGYYQSQGLKVCHISTPDYQRPAPELMNRAADAFRSLPKPVLIHCSAAIDRTTPIVAFIAGNCDPNKLSPELR